MHHEDLLQGEIEDLQREILALKHSADVAPLVKTYVVEYYGGGDEWIKVYFKEGNSPILTEFSEYGASISPLTPTIENGVPVQSVHIASQSLIAMNILSTRPIDHITRV